MDKPAISHVSSYSRPSGISDVSQPQSLHSAAWRAAQEHKWLESQKTGCDLGNSAIVDWYRNHWRAFCRHRRLEHLGGLRRWAEFNEESFGQMDIGLTARSSQPVAHPMLDPFTVGIVFEKLALGCENLNIIDWAQTQFMNSCRPRVDAIIELLTIIDINCARMEPELEESILRGLGSRC